MWLISRRSRFQAGTRYLRRGIDENGKVANYVETEQIVVYKSHLFSFVQIRGSIPVFWSQSNSYRYRPPPKIERGYIQTNVLLKLAKFLKILLFQTDETETYKAFVKHFDEQLSIYEKILLINLVEKNGKEKVLGEAYLKNLLHYNSEKITYITFDFHDQWYFIKKS